MASRLVRLLAERTFTNEQIEKVIPRLHEEIMKEPKYLAEIVDAWNILMNRTSMDKEKFDTPSFDTVPSTAKAPVSSFLGSQNIDMNHILADIEPDLLLLDPEKLIKRHNRIVGLGIAQNLGQLWTLLYNAPRGFYLQDWSHLSKKIYYIEHRLLDFLYEKKEQKSMLVHPLVKSAACVEADFDHIRTRYLFAMRCGYKSLSHLYDVQTALDKPSLKDIVLSDNESFLDKFAPFCTTEEYTCFANLIKNHDIDEDDADVIERLAELDAVNL